MSERIFNGETTELFAYPNVAADPSIYWPSVLSMPLGPGPKRMMFVAPKMNPMISPTAVLH